MKIDLRGFRILRVVSAAALPRSVFSRPRSFSLVTFSLIVAAMVFNCDFPVRASETVPESVKHFLRQHLTQLAGEIDRDTRVLISAVRLKDGARDDFAVYVSGGKWCGSGGCPLLVLKSKEEAYEVIGDISVVHLPVRVLKSRTKGRHEIGVWVQGGGIIEGYEAVLPFDGKEYASNPTVASARHSKVSSRGKVVFLAGAEGELLFRP